MGYALNLYSGGFGTPARDLENICTIYMIIIVRGDRKRGYFFCPSFFFKNNSLVKQQAKKGIHTEDGARDFVPSAPKKGQRLCTCR